METEPYHNGKGAEDTVRTSRKFVLLRLKKKELATR
jgi:hypothetical protein